MKKKQVFLLLNIVLPLVIGTFIYILFYESTYINTFVANFLGIKFSISVSDNHIGVFLTAWACDMLWAYSLTFALYTVFKKFRYGILTAFLMSAVFEMLMEFLQLLPFVHATFDFFDIILEITASFVAVIIIILLKEK